MRSGKACMDGRFSYRSLASTRRTNQTWRRSGWHLALGSLIMAALALILSACGANHGLDAQRELESHDILVRLRDATDSGETNHGGASLSGATVAGVIEVFVEHAEWIHEVLFILDEAPQPHVVTEPPYAISIDTTELLDGEHRLRVQARSADGAAPDAVDVIFYVVNNDDPEGEGGAADEDAGEGEDAGGGEEGAPSDDHVPNEAPAISLPAAAEALVGEPLALEASVFDDGRPSGTLRVSWSKASGPGQVDFTRPDSAKTAATFSAAGRYRLSAIATDGELSSEASVEVEVSAVAEEPRHPLDGDFDGPIRITRGGVYSGRWASDDPRVPAVLILTTEPVVIENSVITGPGHLISTDFHMTTRLTVRNTYGFGQNPNVRGRAPGRFIHVESFADLVVENNYLEGTSGIYVHRWLGGGTVKIRFNEARNVVGLLSDGNGSWLTGNDQFMYAQFVQFNSVHDIADAEIAWNQVINTPGESRTEDVISLFDSSGLPASPISVHDNFIWGSYPKDPAVHTFSGGGIMLGDGGGKHQLALHNQVVNVANYGIAIAGGSHHRIVRNRVVSSGRLEDGTRIDSANVGIYIWDQYPHPFEDNAGFDNVVGYSQIRPNGTEFRNDWWIPDAHAWEGNTRLRGSVTRETELAELERWKEKLRNANITIGVRD